MPTVSESKEFKQTAPILLAKKGKRYRGYETADAAYKFRCRRGAQ